jgi:hypothetical protein
MIETFLAFVGGIAAVSWLLTLAGLAIILVPVGEYDADRDY